MPQKREHYDLIIAWANGETIEYKTRSGLWQKVDVPSFYSNQEYRITKTPDSINWDHVHPDYNYMAKDASDGVFLYENKPTMGTFAWEYTKGNSIVASVFSSFSAGTVDWQNSLVVRPGHE